MGISDFAQEQLTDVVFVELPENGKTVKAGEEIAQVESVKAVSPVYSPVGGEVVEVNDSLPDAPEKVNNSPYGDGWMVKLKMSDPAEADALMSAAEYKEFIAAEGR
jgi:glycine cleavage system H protein